MSQKRGGWLSRFIEFEKEVPDTDLNPEDLDSGSIEELLARTRSLTSEAGSTVPVPVTVPASTVSATPRTGPSSLESKDLKDIYAESGCVPPAPKSVESVIAFLDGIQKMPEEVQRAALAAMDDAEDAWTINDVVLDAKNKMQACEVYKSTLSGTLTAAQTNAQSEIQAQDALISKANETIDAEIADLEEQIRKLKELRSQESASAEAAKATARSALQTTTEACAREAARMDSHIERLRHFIHSFGPKAQEASS